MSVHKPSDLAAVRGEPSYVWRSGQERRLKMFAERVELTGKHILEAGCGEGLYAHKLITQYQAEVDAFDIEQNRVRVAQTHVPRTVVAQGEHLPYPDDTFDVVFSNEVIEHVNDDQQFAAEMVRVTRAGGRIAIFCPNRWYPVEQHGIYWRGEYRFGNIPLVNYLPDFLRNRLAPHVRTYTARGIRRVFKGQPVRVVYHSRIFGGYDNIVNRYPRAGHLLRKFLYALEKTPLRVLGLSHWIILERTAD
jgi:SAM-dependent methyltransferase